MAVEAARVVVNITADTKGLEQGAEKAESAIKGLASSFGEIAIGTIATVAAEVAMMAFGAAVEIAKTAVIGYNSMLEQNRVAFTTLTGSAEQADDLLREMAAFAEATPFEFPDVVKATRSFMSLGLSAAQTRPMLIAIADAVAASGGGSDKIDAVTRAFTQMGAKGKVSAEEINQLNEAGLNGTAIYTQLAETMGKSRTEVMEMASDGKIAVEDMYIAFQQLSKNEWGGAAEKQAATFEGAMSSVKDALLSTAGTAFQPFFEMLREGLIRFQAFMKTDEFAAWVGRIQGYARIAAAGLGYLTQAFAANFQAILTIVTTIGSLIYRVLSYLNPFATHSPSLVSQVIEGTAIIAKQYADLGASVPAALAPVSKAVEDFIDIAGPGVAQAMAASDAELRKTIGFLGGEAVDAYDRAASAVEELENEARRLENTLRDEESALKGMEQALEPMIAALAQTRQELNDVKRDLDQARDKLQEFMDAPLKGTKAFEDAMFRNTVAVKKLELAIVNMKLGGALEKARASVDKVRQSLEKARDKLNDFLNASLVGTKKYSDALFANEQAQNKLKLQLIDLKSKGTLSNPEDEAKRLAEIESIEGQLDGLGTAAEKLRLQESLDLDPQRRALEQITNTSKELTFEEAKNGIINSMREVDKYEGSLQRAEKALQKQEERYDKLVQQIERLRLESEKMEIERWLEIEPALRAAADAYAVVLGLDKEITIEEKVAGIEKWGTEIGKLQPQYDALVKLEEQQQKEVDEQNKKIEAQKEVIASVKEQHDLVTAATKMYSDQLDTAIGKAKELESAAKAAAAAAESAAKAGAKGGGADAGAGGGFDPSKLPSMGEALGGVDFKRIQSESEATFNSLLPNLTQFQTDVDAIGKKVQIWAENMKTLDKWVTDNKTTWDEWGKNLKTASDFMDGALAKVSQWGVDLHTLGHDPMWGKMWQESSDSVKKWEKETGDSFTNFKTNVTTNVETTMDSTKKNIETSMTTSKDSVVNALNFIGTEGDRILKGYVGDVNTNFTKMKTDTMTTYENLKTGVIITTGLMLTQLVGDHENHNILMKGVIDKGYEEALKVYETAKKDLPELAKTTSDTIKTHWTNLQTEDAKINAAMEKAKKDAFEGMKTETNRIAGDIYTAVTGWFSKTEDDSTKTINEEMTPNMKTGFQKTVDTIVSVLSDATGLTRINAEFKMMGEEVKKIIDGNEDSLLNKAKAATIAVMEAMKAAAISKKDEIIKVFTDIYDAVKRWYDNIVALAKAALNIKTPAPTPAPDTPPGDTPEPPDLSPPPGPRLPEPPQNQTTTLQGMALRPLNRLPVPTMPNSMNIVVTLDGKEIGRTVAPVITGDIRVRTAIRV